MSISVRTIAEYIDPKTRFYLSCASHAAQVAICETVPCPVCKAKEGEYCIGVYGRSISAGGRHADRCTDAKRWRKANPKEWKRIKNQAFRVLVKAGGHQ